jgi:hypothetical protein
LPLTFVIIGARTGNATNRVIVRVNWVEVRIVAGLTERRVVAIRLHKQVREWFAVIKTTIFYTYAIDRVQESIEKSLAGLPPVPRIVDVIHLPHSHILRVNQRKGKLDIHLSFSRFVPKADWKRRYINIVHKGLRAIWDVSEIGEVEVQTRLIPEISPLENPNGVSRVRFTGGRKIVECDNAIGRHHAIARG